jgi:hypothetical protein
MPILGTQRQKIESVLPGQICDRHQLAFSQQQRIDALDAAEALSSDGTVEVWSERGRIARVKTDNKPSGPEDALPG